MLSGFSVAWLVPNDWDCLMSLWKNHALFLLFGSIILVFSFDALFGLSWRMLTHVRVIQSFHKPLWSFSFWLLMPSYAYFNVALSLCMIMAVIALLVGRSQSFASPHFVLSHTKFPSTFDFLLSILQIKLFLVLCENWSVKLSRTWWHTLLFSL
jgi:hypothetical protein